MSAVATEPPPVAAHSWDWPLAIIALVLAGFGLLMILSASSLGADATYGNALHFVGRQSAGLIVGVLISAVVLAIPFATLRRLAWPGYVSTLFLLLAVMAFGQTVNGATRWLSLGPVNLQPSEFAKIALVMVLSDYLANNRGRLWDAVGVGLPGLGLALPLVVLVVFQKDLGATVILLGLAGVLFFVAGLQWRYAFGGVAAGLSLLVALVAMEPYRLQRLTSFADPFAHADDAGYQVVQGWIALATGGAFGVGIANGVAQYGFLPEAHTDFIVAVIGEELGAVGWIAVIVLLAGLVWRAFHIAERAPELYGTLVAAGIGAMFAAQAIINIGVVGGVLPAKGLVLPFLSYGASAAVVHTVSVGILLKISMLEEA